MPRPPVRATRKLSEAEEWGKLKAQEKMRLKKHKFTIESLVVSAREHVGKLIDTMTFKDIIDVVAAAGLTPIIHDAILTLPKITKTLKTLTFTELGSVLGSIIFPGIGTSIGALIGIITADLFKQYVTPGSKEEKKPEEKTMEEQIQEFMSWLLAFSISWCIVKWGDKMINAGIGTLPTIISMLSAV